MSYFQQLVDKTKYRDKSSYLMGRVIIDSDMTHNTYLGYPVRYEDLNKDPETVDRMIKYFFTHLDKWLKDDLSNVLKYFIVKDTKVILSKDGKGDTLNPEIKTEYIKENILTKHKMKRLLTRIVDKTDINWYDMVATYRTEIRKLIGKYIIKKATK